ncbi:hypothetical protein QQ045_008368 [Rhodiola kirilowii]
MEISVSSRQKISNSDDILTFPNTKNNDHIIECQDSDQDNQTFEFKFDHSAAGSSDSPGSPYKDSPADHLFRNGILLPHTFPVQPMYYYYGSDQRTNYQRSASRTSSVGSKDSLISSRSNSTNSRSSSCSSSARTSLSADSSSERKLLYYNAMKGYHHQKRPLQQPVLLDQVYGSSRRWQFLTPVPVPVMTQEISLRPKKLKDRPQEEAKAKRRIKTKKKTSAGSWSILRFFCYVLSVCRECHALEPSVRNVSSIHEISNQ